MKQGLTGFCALCVIGLLAGCASEVQRTPVQFTPYTDQRPVLRVREPAIATPVSGYRSLIKQGSTWRFVGRTPQGDVYQPIGGAFTVNGANVHEAYLVMTEGYVVGFYLPGEGAFSPLSNKIRLTIE